MQFDFSALDAELESLGRPADDALALARAFAPEIAPGAASLHLDDIDDALFTLESESGALPAGAIPAWSPTRIAAVAVASPLAPAGPASPVSSPPDEVHALGPTVLTQSQEIVLPDPIARDELSLEVAESGELRLDSDEPSSGSFELADVPTAPRITQESMAPPQDLAPAHDSEARALAPFDEIQDALDGSQPILLSSTTRPSAAPLGDRDPDAEFDALLSEATDPRGIPTSQTDAPTAHDIHGMHDIAGDVDADDLLRGLELDDELQDEEVSEAELAEADDDPHEAELLTRSLFEEPIDSTEITDRNTMFDPGNTLPDHTPQGELALDELDSGELEIMMDDEESVATVAPPAPQSSKAPPPPPAGGDKRPSSGLLGRLFSKRDGE